MQQRTPYPFTAIVGADDMSLALILTSIAPEVGGVLVRGEKGTAKSTMVRALADVLPTQPVIAGCRFGCDPSAPEPDCPDGPHQSESAAAQERPARLVELPVGATEDRVIGSLDLRKALGAGEAAFEPGLLATAHRGILYVDEVNLLHDHLVDLLLDAAAMGRNTVERDGVSISHPARIVLVGTMNPEEGELRPQLLDRFGLTVEVAASREPRERTEVVRRRLAYDADPAAFARDYAAQQAELTARIAATRDRLDEVTLDDRALATVARVCAGFDVDGMRADIVTARTARAHAAWQGRTEVTRADIRAAALLALPHRRRRNPFDAPGLDEELLDQLLDEEPPEPPDGGGEDPTDDSGDGPEDQDDTPDGDGGDGSQEPGPQDPQGHPEPSRQPEPSRAEHPSSDQTSPEQADEAEDAPDPAEAPPSAAPTVGVASAGTPYRARRFAVRGTGSGRSGRRSAACTESGRTVGVHAPGHEPAGAKVHLLATLTAGAARRATTGEGPGGPTGASAGSGAGLRLQAGDLRHAVTRGRESNLVLLAVDASGSMAARRRMDEVKTAVLSLLMDAYQRRDRVGLITFRGEGAELALPPTTSVDAAAARLEDLPHGGRTPVAEGLLEAARVIARERIRDPRQRALLLVLTDGRATAGEDALARSRRVADAWSRSAAADTDVVVIDCETGRFRMGLAADLARRMGAEHVPLEQVAAGAIVDVVDEHRARRPDGAAGPHRPDRRSAA